MATPDQIRRWLSDVTRDWYGACAGLAYNIIAKNGGEAYRSYGSATEAYNDTVIESRDPALAPPGAQHYWYYYGKDWRGILGNWGHVATDIYGGGHSILSATRNARQYWGVHAGILSVAAQTVGGMRYLGWSRTYGRRNRITIDLAPPTPSGGGETPLPIPTRGWDEMASPEEIRAIVADEVNKGVGGFVAKMRRGRWGMFVVHGTGRAEDSGDPRNGVWLLSEGRFTQISQPVNDYLNSTGTADGVLSSNYETLYTLGNKGAFDNIVNHLVNQYEPADLTDPAIAQAVKDALAEFDIDEAAIAESILTTLSPELLATKLIAAGLGEAVVAALGEKLSK